jgi:hypothetical protein
MSTTTPEYETSPRDLGAPLDALLVDAAAGSLRRVGRALWRAWVVSPRRGSSTGLKRRLYSRDHGLVGDHCRDLAMPLENTVHRLCGQSVGGVSERAGVKAGGISLRVLTPSRVVAVKDILVVWKAALFAGRRRNEDLGRSVEHCGYPPAVDVAPMTADARRAPRRGTPSRMRHKAHAPDAGTRNRACARETRPSLGPSTRARQSSLHILAQARMVRRSLRHHGWANPRKWEEPALGSG